MSGRKLNGSETHILNDVAIIALSVLIAILLVNTGVLANLLSSTSGALGAFIAGMFFTSIFTTAPAVAALGEVSLLQGVLATALFGALGSMVGDLVIFRFVRDRFSEHIAELLFHKKNRLRRLHLLFKRRFFRWITFLAGGLIISSPLPDELAIALLGFSKVEPRYFALLSFAFNFIGIAAIGLIAHSLVG